MMKGNKKNETHPLSGSSKGYSENILTPVTLSGVVAPWSENLSGGRTSDYKLISNSGLEYFIVADDEQVSTPEFVRRLARAAGVSSRLFPMPVSLLSPLLKFSGRPDAHDSIIGSLELNVSKAAATGWHPQVTLDEGLRRATNSLAL